LAVEKLKISEIRAASVGLPEPSSGSRGLDWPDLYFLLFPVFPAALIDSAYFQEETYQTTA
jgi:hypothetical protein